MSAEIFGIYPWLSCRIRGSFRLNQVLLVLAVNFVWTPSNQLPLSMFVYLSKSLLNWQHDLLELNVSQTSLLLENEINLLKENLWVLHVWLRHSRTAKPSCTFPSKAIKAYYWNEATAFRYSNHLITTYWSSENHQVSSSKSNVSSFTSNAAIRDYIREPNSSTKRTVSTPRLSPRPPCAP